MKISPSYSFSVFGEEEFSEMMSDASRQLVSIRQEGYFSGFDGVQLYYEYFLAEQSQGAVVVAHGLGEFTRKYYEFAWYLLNQGYDVFLYDQRSHGRSARMTSHPDMVHVDAFSDYHKDLHCFVSDVVAKATNNPLYLYGHSMGGAVAAQYLAAHPQVFQKAILSAPMIQPLTGKFPPFAARIGLSAYLLFCKPTEKFWGAREFDPNYSFERSHDRSHARFQYHQDMRLTEKCYRTTPLSVRWVQQSVSLRRQLTSKKFLKQIQTPVLLVSASNDRMVSTQAQIDFAERCELCQRAVLPDTTHAILGGTQETMAAHIRQVLDYFC